MRGFFYTWLAAAALFGLLVCAPAEAEELVKFASAGQGEPIQGYLSRPRGAGPFPAVVLLHSCLGLPAERAAIGERIATWGYVALYVDDFATRGLKETCAVDFKPAVADAYGALAHLASLPDVDPARVAAVGFSQGGDTALKIATGGGPGRLATKARSSGRRLLLSSMRQCRGRCGRHPDPDPGGREGRGDPRSRLRRAGEAAADGHGEAGGLSGRGARL